MSNCKCKQPPCKCTSKDRDTICDHRERKIGWEKCKSEKGILRDDCNYFFSSKRVLCDEHYEVHKEECGRLCGICGVKRVECCC
jgi:hypothetical protein